MEKVEEPTPHGRLRANELQERECDANSGEELHLARRDEAIPASPLNPLMNLPAEAPPGPESHGTPRKPPPLNGIGGRRTASNRVEKHIQYASRPSQTRNLWGCRVTRGRIWNDAPKASGFESRVEHRKPTSRGPRVEVSVVVCGLGTVRHACSLQWSDHRRGQGTEGEHYKTQGAVKEAE